MAWSSVTTPVTGTPASSSAFGIPVAGNMAILGGAWSTYTPTLTNITLGNGTLAGRYRAVGKTVDFLITLTFGSTTSITGSNSKMTLPVTALSGNWTSGDCAGYDTSANQWFPLCIFTAAAGGGASTADFLIKTYNTSAGSNAVTISSSAPFTWATGDVLTIRGKYEAA